VDAETGKPLGGLRAKFQTTVGELYAYESLESDESSADGAFRIPEVPSGTYRALAVSATPGQPIPAWTVVQRENGLVTVVGGEATREKSAHQGGAAIGAGAVLPFGAQSLFEAESHHWPGGTHKCATPFVPV
jgi:hypothetical protein